MQPIGVRPVQPNNVAQDIIQFLMIATNGLCVRFLRKAGFPSLRRVVKSPKQWERIAEIW